MELTEDLLIRIGGWDAIKQARVLHASGGVEQANYEFPLLKGRVRSGGKTFLSGLRIKTPADIQNLCPCKDSQLRGLICSHALAVGLSALHPKPIPSPALSKPEEADEAEADLRPHVRTNAKPTTEFPQVEFRFEGSLNQIEGGLNFRYSEEGVSNETAELREIMELEKAGFSNRGVRSVLSGEAKILSFFAAKLPEWNKRWKVIPGERFLHVTRNLIRLEPRFDLRESGSEGWLDFRLHYSAGKEAVLSAQDLQRLLSGGQNSIPLRSGKIAVVDTGLLSDIEEVLRDCDPGQSRGAWKISNTHRGYLQRTIARWAGGKPPNEESDIQLGSLEGTLRVYQAAGARWLLARSRQNLGGILADEMGLGKTVQALGAIEKIGGPALVVCPSSLVWNWESEATRFLPNLSLLTLEGPDRAKHFARIAQTDLTITSYALLRRDIDVLRKLEFSTVILDEAQHIKNPGSLNAKAACDLQAGSRFILTGTPIENSLQDLWSLFEFLLPGYLGTRTDFRERYEVPLQSGAQGPVFERLRRRTDPFILRRRKSEILRELPPKIEQVVEVELSPVQKRAYDQLQEAARGQIDALKNQSDGAARMKALTALLRLRQVCCDVRLLGGDREGGEEDSAKLLALMELIEEAMDGSHRTLVFSQFTSMLDLIGTSLNKREIPFCRLDGSTKDRSSPVKEFQSNPGIPVFLISLKAGGTGLNLTNADTVIHFDPWWNPAVEAQATDRAHRIGQYQVVNSIKLIARETVEQRVLQLQASKALLQDAALDEVPTWGKMELKDLASLVG